MTKQEIINKIIEFYQNGGLPGYSNTNGVCLYRKGKNSKCAIGCLMDETTLKKASKTTLAIDDLFEHAKSDHVLLGALQDLTPTDAENKEEAIFWLREVQKVHDSLCFKGDFSVDNLKQGLEVL